MVEKQLSDFELMELNTHIANHLQYNVFKDVGYIYCLELECGKYYVGYSVTLVSRLYIEKFGVNNVRGGWFNYSGEDESVILACYGRRTNW